MRVAVGLGLHQRLQADGAVGAAAVLDVDLLAEPVRQVLGDQPGDEIGAAAGRERHDHLDRPSAAAQPCATRELPAGAREQRALPRALRTECAWVSSR